MCFLAISASDRLEVQINNLFAVCILQLKFTALVKVKCLNHTQGKRYDVAGAVTVIVIPDLRNQSTLNPLEPRASFAGLAAIKDYLRAHTSPFIDIQVLNPLFERIYLDVQVHFHKGFDEGFYGKQLNEDLKQFLSPWAYRSSGWNQLNFGTRIHQSHILSFIEARPYVDFVYRLKLQQRRSGEDSLGLGKMFVADETNQRNSAAFKVIGDWIADGIEVAETTSPQSILVSAPEHTVTVLSDTSALTQSTQRFGIDYMSIGFEFAVGQPMEPGIGDLAIGKDFQLSLAARGK